MLKVNNLKKTNQKKLEQPKEQNLQKPGCPKNSFFWLSTPSRPLPLFLRNSKCFKLSQIVLDIVPNCSTFYFIKKLKKKYFCLPPLLKIAGIIFKISIFEKYGLKLGNLIWKFYCKLYMIEGWWGATNFFFNFSCITMRDQLWVYRDEWWGVVYRDDQQA